MSDYIDLSELKPDKKNARKHNPRNIGMITQAIQEIGVSRSGVIDEDGNILAGNGTYEALSEAGIKKVKVVDVDGEEWVVVRRKGLSEAEKTKLSLYDNRTAEIADWDVDILKEIYEESPEILDGLFYEDEVDALLEDVDKDPGELEGEDDVPQIPEEPVTQRGDIYLLGKHRLMCGDSTNHDDVEMLMNGKKADMVFTDPPYNVDYGNIKHPKFKMRSIKNDNQAPHEFKQFCEKFANTIKQFCNGIVYVFGAPNLDGRIMFSILDNLFHCSTTIIWNKDQFTLGRGKYQNKYEPFWFGWVNDGSLFTNDRKLTNVWDIERPKSSDLHPTMKPVKLVETALIHASKTGSIVFDLFGGAGSTIVAAEKLKRKCYMMEVEPKYCDVIVDRYKDLFPDKPVERIKHG